MAGVARDPRDVIEALLTVVPPEMAAIRMELERMRAAVSYLPPEYKFPIWARLQRAFERGASRRW